MKTTVSFKEKSRLIKQAQAVTKYRTENGKINDIQGKKTPKIKMLTFKKNKIKRTTLQTKDKQQKYKVKTINLESFAQKIFKMCFFKLHFAPEPLFETTGKTNKS